jgi:hypothetical protein
MGALATSPSVPMPARKRPPTSPPGCHDLGRPASLVSPMQGLPWHRATTPCTSKLQAVNATTATTVHAQADTHAPLVSVTATLIVLHWMKPPSPHGDCSRTALVAAATTILRRPPLLIPTRAHVPLPCGHQIWAGRGHIRGLQPPPP